MTRRDELANVLDGIDAAQAAGFDPVKINAVIERGVNDDEIVDLATFGREQGIEVRFIEFMPLDADGHWVNDQVVGQDEIVADDQRRVPDRADAGARCGAGRSVPLPRRRWHGRRDPDGHQAVLWRLRPGAAHGRGRLPHVPVRHDRGRRCSTCSASGGSDDDIAALIEAAVATKWAGHRINQVNFIRPGKSMSQIGG